jgi:AraC-like DNA-binding protein
MQVKLYSSKWGELYCIEAPETTDGFTIAGTKHFLATNTPGDYYFLFQEFEENGFKIRLNYFRSKGRDVYTLLTDSMITLHFGFLHSHQIYIPHLGKLTFHERNYNLLDIPQVSVEFTMEPGQEFTFFDIVLTNEYLQGFTAGFSELLDDFLKKAAHLQPAKLCDHNQVATIEVLHWIDEIMQFGNETEKPRSSFDTIVAQLVRTCLYFMKERPVRKASKIPIKDAEKLYAVAALLETTQENFTIQELAAKFKISAYKLDKGFKEIYNHSVLHHRTEEKMRLALRLVSNKRYSIKQVAHKLGYSDSGTFIRAFKNRFGYTPGKNVHKP